MTGIQGEKRLIACRSAIRSQINVPIEERKRIGDVGRASGSEGVRRA